MLFHEKKNKAHNYNLSTKHKVLSMLSKDEMLIKLGEASLDFLQKESEMKSAKSDYVCSRDEYISKNSNGLKKSWEYWVSDKGFQKATLKDYRNYLLAKKEVYNSRRRLDTQFRKAKDILGITYSEIMK